MQTSPDSMLVPSPNVLARSVGDELVLLDLQSELYFGLDQVAAAMWTAICEHGSVLAAHGALVEMFDVDEDTLRADLNELVGQLVDKRLLQLAQIVSVCPIMRLIRVLRAMPMVPVLLTLDAALFLVGLTRVDRSLTWVQSRPEWRSGREHEGDPRLEERTRRFVANLDRAAVIGRTNGRCLRRSLVLRAWLARHGVAAELELGVRRLPDGMTAHAWVTWADQPIYEDAEVIETHVSFGPFSGLRRQS